MRNEPFLFLFQERFSVGHDVQGQDPPHHRPQERGRPQAGAVPQGHQGQQGRKIYKAGTNELCFVEREREREREDCASGHSLVAKLYLC